MSTTETEIKPEIKFTDEQIRNLLCCALEGGSNYWYTIVGYTYPPDRDADSYKSKNETPRYLYVPLHEGGIVTFGTDEDDEINGEKRWPLDRAAITRGFEIMRNKYPRHFADVVAENEDGDTGDVFLQCCLFGEIVFG